MKRFLVLLDCKYSSSSYVFAVGELYDITANSDKEAIDLAKSRTCCKNPKVVKVKELSDNDKIPDLVTNCEVYDGNEWKSYSNGKLVEFSSSRINNFTERLRKCFANLDLRIPGWKFSWIATKNWDGDKLFICLILLGLFII